MANRPASTHKNKTRIQKSNKNNSKILQIQAKKINVKKIMGSSMKIKKIYLWGKKRAFIELKEDDYGRLVNITKKYSMGGEMTLGEFFAECFIVKPIPNFRLAYHPSGISIGIDLGEKGRPLQLTFISREKTMQNIEKILGKEKTKRLLELFKHRDKKMSEVLKWRNYLLTKPIGSRGEDKLLSALVHIGKLQDKERIVERIDSEIKKSFRPLIINYCKKRKWIIPLIGPSFISDKAKIMSNGSSWGVGSRKTSKKLVKGTYQWPITIKEDKGWHKEIKKMRAKTKRQL
ncbi:MAG: hypothetical protein AB1467_06415 [Candidatus Diapherotrites archaeon]